MTFKKATATSLLLIGIGTTSFAAPPPLDRPTPPPCCADGRCYPNVLTFGWYETRWRRWPVECMEPIPAGQQIPGTQPIEGIPTFEPPTPEEEDRKAPPPTAPRAEEQTIKTPPLNAPPGPGGNAPQGPGGVTPPTAPPMTPPNESKEPGGPLRTLPPYEPKVPGPKPLTMNNTGPTGDMDPPPALPFGPRPIEAAPPVREVQQRPVMPARQPAPTMGSVPSDDPPPSLPVALASWSN